MSVDQSTFTSALFDPEQGVPKGLVNPDGTQASKRFDIYRNNVMHSLIEAMGEAFPATKKIVGDGFFEAAATLYIRQSPPKSPILMLYGDDFSEFLAGFAPAESIPYLPEIAAYEYQRRRVYHAKDSIPIAADLLAGMDEETLLASRFEMSPALHLHRYEHPVESIWRYNMLDQNDPIDNGPEHVLVARPELDLVGIILTGDHFAFLGALLEQQPFSTALERASEINPSFDLSAALGLAFQHHLFITIKT